MKVKFLDTVVSRYGNWRAGQEADLPLSFALSLFPNLAIALESMQESMQEQAAIEPKQMETATVKRRGRKKNAATNTDPS